MNITCYPTGCLCKQLLLILAILFLLLFSAVSASQSPSTPRFSIIRFVVEGDNPLTKSDIDPILSPFIGDQEGLDRLNSAAAQLQQLLHDKGFTSHRVILPDQTLQEGVVKLKVISFKIGKVKVSGNQNFSKANIISSIPGLQAGRVPNTKELSRQLLLANEHPAKQLTLKFQESETPEAIDASLEVKDNRPYNVFASFNNYSSQNTPDTRLTLGGQYSNLFDLDHTFTASYTTSPEDVSRVKQYGFSYKLPIYWLAGAFNVYYIKSDVDSGQVAGIFDVSGEGEFLGGSYTQHLGRIGRYRHSALLSVDDKLFENKVSFAGAPIGKDVRSRPFTLRYSGQYGYTTGNMGFYAAYVRNLPGGEDNDEVAYAASRFGAEDNWDAWRMGINGNYYLFDNWLLSGRVDAQVSDEPLIPSEQFGAGGFNSVRGYNEREVSGDSGLAASVELWSPPIKYNIRAIGFFDGGYLDIQNPLPGKTGDIDLFSVGFGLRGFWENYASAKLDVTRTLSNAGGTEAGDTRVHFNLIFRY